MLSYTFVYLYIITRESSKIIMTVTVGGIITSPYFLSVGKHRVDNQILYESLQTLFYFT
jgi:hypothetical protein